jgi:hypothetical protein
MTITKIERSRARRCVRTAAALICTAALVPGNVFALGWAEQNAGQQEAAPADATPIPGDQLDALVAPIALYPDPLLAQVLAASTYPLELLQLHQWLQKNPGLKDKALADAVAQRPWDPSIQAMAGLPDLVKRLSDDIQWTADLGNAFLAQQADVMEAVQRMRQRAHDKGTLKTTQQQTVETQVVENESVIVIEQASPDIVYIPTYNPLTVWGPWTYPYPPIYYPPPGYYAAGAAIAFGAGVAMGAFWGGGGWGWGPRWGDNDITINRNNNFNRNAAIRGGDRNTSNRWQHRPEHRGGAPYRDRATANRYGGTARGDSLSQRQAGARQQVQRQGGNVRSGAVGTTGVGERAGAGSVGDRAGGVGGDRAGAGSLGARSGSTGSFGGGADRVGSHDLSRSSGGGNRGAFGDSGGFSGSSARSSSSRGSSSMGSSRPSGGGMSRGGGGMSRGGGSRGGGRR